MEPVFEICNTQIPFSKILEYRVIDREYIYRPAYYVTTDFWHNKKYTFSHMIPYAAICDESENKSAIKAFRAITAKDAIKVETTHALLTTIGDKFNIKALKYKKFICRNQAGRHFETYLQDVPASVETEDGKRSEVYPNDELYKHLGEPIAPSIDYIPALLILTKDELHTFYRNGIQIDAQFEYERLKQGITEYQLRLEAEQAAKKNEKLKVTMPKIPKIQAPHINLPQIEKKTDSKQKKIESKVIEDVEFSVVEQDSFDPMDINHDGVVDEKDLELLKQMIEKKQTIEK